ncbi:transcription termination/antitermination protein NusA [PVC group bacterium]|nr:transcription termination/antitermination protein NusA [PVC group bacterium]
MNSELVAILNYMEKERGINREVLVEAVEFAMQTALRKTSGGSDGLSIAIDRKSYDIKAYKAYHVVESPADDQEISLDEARKIDPEVEIDGEVKKETQIPPNFGRIAAQTAKQAITQRIREAERGIVYDEYKDRVGDIVSGGVRQFNRSDIVVDLGRAEAVIPSRERVPTEEYQVGDRIRAYVLSVQNEQSGASIVLSRSHPDFVRRLFELEVSEINDGVVEIKGIAREPGYRTKIAVVSKDEKVDPVGACVGMRGMRVKNIVRELSGEKIDIVRWNEDIKTYVTNALSPAKLAKVTVCPEEGNIIHIIADADQLSLAIGKRGQNVRLSAKLIGWKIDIQKDASQISFEEQMAMAVETLATIENISKENAEKLVKAGFHTVEGVLASDVAEIAEMAEIEEDEAKSIYEAAAVTQSSTEATEAPEETTNAEIED